MATFLILLTYVRPLNEIDRLVADHNAYLERNYNAGRFIVSGRREPRTGGVIIAHAGSVGEINATVAEDPFIREGVAEHEVIEFVPSKWARGFETL